MYLQVVAEIHYTFGKGNNVWRTVTRWFAGRVASTWRLWATCSHLFALYVHCRSVSCWRNDNVEDLENDTICGIPLNLFFLNLPLSIETLTFDHLTSRVYGLYSPSSFQSYANRRTLWAWRFDCKSRNVRYFVDTKLPSSLKTLLTPVHQLRCILCTSFMKHGDLDLFDLLTLKYRIRDRIK